MATDNRPLRNDPLIMPIIRAVGENKVTEWERLAETTYKTDLDKHMSQGHSEGSFPTRESYIKTSILRRYESRLQSDLVAEQALQRARARRKDLDSRAG